MLELCLWASLLVPQGDEKEFKFATQKFTLQFRVAGEPDQLKVVQLWVTRDQGKSWKPSSESGIKEEWGPGKAAPEPHWTLIPGTITVPEDGTYGFLLQVRNGQETPRPVASTAPAITVIVASPPVSLFPEILQPREGDELSADMPVLIRWAAPKKGYRPNSVCIFASFAGEGEMIVGKDLPLEGTKEWRTPARDGGKLRMRIVAFKESGLEMKGLELRTLTLRGSPEPPLRWLYPNERVQWSGGETVELQWTALRGDFAPRSGALYYSIDDSKPFLITKGLDPAGFYFWTVPSQATDKLHLTIAVTTTGGQVHEAKSVALTIKPSFRANIELARKNADRARILAAQGRTGFAIAAYEESLSYWAEYPEALNDVGAVYASEKQYAKALECFLRAKRASPSSAVPYVNAASMEIKLALLDDALADLKDAVDLGVDHDVRLALQASVQLWLLARAYADAGDRKHSDECCDQILRIRNAEKKIRVKAQDQLEQSRTP